VSSKSVLSVDVRTEPSLVETEIEILGSNFRLIQVTVADPADVQAAIEQHGKDVAAIAVSGIDVEDLSLDKPATSGQELGSILQEWTVRHVSAVMPDYFLNARVLTLFGGDCPDVEGLLSIHTDNFTHWSANHPLAELSIPIMEVDFDIPLTDQVELRVAWLTRKAARFTPDEIAGPASKLIRDAAEMRLGSHLNSAQVIIGGQEAVIDKGVDLAGKTFLGSSLTGEQVESLGHLHIDLIVDCVPQPFEGITVTAATLDALILADKGSDITESDRLDAIGQSVLEPMLHFPHGPRRTSRFAFVIHPLSQEYFRNVGAIDSLAKFGPPGIMGAVEKTMAHAPPFVYSKVTGVTSPTGARTEGWLITVGGTPKELLAHDPEFTYKRLLAAAEMARKLGAQIMGLGAFTKVVGDAGVTVARRASLPITTGNSYSASGALWALQAAILKLGIADIDADGRMHGKSMVVGATGSIGSVCARLLAMASDELWLVSPESAKLLALKDEIELENPRARIRVSSNADDHLPEMDAIVTATSAAGKKVVDIMRVKPGAVITDVARPLDMSAEDVAKRPDVLVVESGEIELPGTEVRMKDIGLPRGVAYACLAETVVLALEGRFETFTVGRDIEWPKVKEIYRLGLQHGMNLAAISGANGVHTDDDIAAVREAALAARDTWTPPDPQ
jgi:predicted amino acid dehydrogenase